MLTGSGIKKSNQIKNQISWPISGACPYAFYIEKFITQFKTTEKMIGHHTRFRENGDLRPWRSSAAKKKPPFFNAHALITRKIMRNSDAQCNTGE